jgi:mannose-6-phosphate isomerase-like protein (cupin superfamily)
MSQSLEHIPLASTNVLDRGPLSLRLLNSTPHHILIALTVAPQSTGFPVMSNTIIAATFHVIRGAVRFTTCNENSTTAPTEEIDISRGATISAPPTSFYGISNPFEEDAEVLCVYSPGGWAHCLEEWASFVGDWEGEEAKKIMRKCGTVFLGDEPRDQDADGEDDDELDFNPQLRCMA